MKTGINVVSVTFDGCPSNISIVKQLRCNLNPNNLQTIFTIDKFLPINILPAPAYMVKLMRNTFGEKLQMIDDRGQLMNFKFVQKFLILQDNENFHLTNQLKKQYIFFVKQKIKVKLETQLLSRLL